MFNWSLLTNLCCWNHVRFSAMIPCCLWSGYNYRPWRSLFDTEMVHYWNITCLQSIVIEHKTVKYRVSLIPQYYKYWGYQEFVSALIIIFSGSHSSQWSSLNLKSWLQFLFNRNTLTFIRFLIISDYAIQNLL